MKTLGDDRAYWLALAADAEARGMHHAAKLYRRLAAEGRPRIVMRPRAQLELL